MDRRSVYVRIISICVLVAVMILLTVLLWPALKEINENPESFKLFIQSKGFGGKLLLIALVSVQVVFAIMPGEPFEIGAGYAFGAWQGLLLCSIGIAIGSCAVFFLSRKYGKPLVESIVSKEALTKIERLCANRKRLEAVIFIIFFIPGTPKDVLTYFAGLTPIKFRDFILISAVARVPSVVTSTLGGSALGEGNFKLAAIVFAITFIVAGAGFYLYNKMVSNSEKE